MRREPTTRTRPSSLDTSDTIRVLMGLVLTAAMASAMTAAGCATRDPADPNAGPRPHEAGVADAAVCSPDEGLRLYDERIDPLFRDDRPSTCNQCHLSGINLRQYVQGSPCETYACMVEQHLVDEKHPERSKVLAWIERARPESELITQEVIDAEYNAFLEWISYNATCSACESVACPLPSDAGTFCPNEDADPHGETNDAGVVDPGGCTSDALETVFRTSVYSHRGRCAPCHFNIAESAEYEAPVWIEVAPDCETGSRITMDNVIRNGYVDLDAPEQSLLLLKPLAESNGGLPHGGGDKFDGADDPGYRSFLYFIERLSDCQGKTTQ